MESSHDSTILDGRSHHSVLEPENPEKKTNQSSKIQISTIKVNSKSGLNTTESRSLTSIDRNSEDNGNADIAISEMNSIRESPLFTVLATNKSKGKYKEERWLSQYRDLVDFHEESGHFDVPYGWKKNKALGRWVGTQRNQFRQLKDGRPSYITQDRIKLLNSVGFNWDAVGINRKKVQHIGTGKNFTALHKKQWMLRYEELVEFCNENGHCAVPHRASPKYRHLSKWVGRQREQYKLYGSGVPSRMTAERVEKLNKIGFIWNAKFYGKWRQLDKIKKDFENRRHVSAEEQDKKIEQHELNKKMSAFDDNNSNKSSVVSFPSKNCSGDEAVVKNDIRKTREDSVKPASKNAEDKKVGFKSTDSFILNFSDDRKKSFNSTPKDDMKRKQEQDWQIKLGMLRDFYQKNGHSIVPSNKNCLNQHEFFMWINIQRTNYKFFYDGKPTCLTANQIVQLEKLGFAYSR